MIMYLCRECSYQWEKKDTFYCPECGKVAIYWRDDKNEKNIKTNYL